MFLRSVFFIVMGLTSVVAEDVSFNFQIRPILSDKCFGCHGPDEENKKGDLRLDLASEAHKVFVPGKPDESEAWQRINTDDQDDVMPPPKSHLSLSEKEKELLLKWIQTGAKYEKHWAFTSLPETIPVPKLIDSNNAIDQFIQQKFPEGLSFNPEAEPRLLARRASLVLTGLPPDEKLMSAYLKHPTQEAYEAYIQALLESPSYAEHLAVSWMDYARFSDSYGFQVDRPRDMTAWRDWVIEAFDQNMPYDQFITWQLAGDLIPEPTHESILATAFNRLHQQKVEGGSIPEEFRTEYVADRTHTMGTVMLGLTFECARCHDHKFDDISQKDYYRLFSFFNNIDEAGLYSYFTSSMPTPTLRLGDAAFQKKKQAAAEAVKKAEASLRQHFNNLQPSIKTVTLPKPLAHYTFDDLKDGMKNKISGQYHASGHAKTVDGLQGGAIELTGDHEIKLGDLGKVDRAEPFSIRLNMKSPVKYDRAVVLHRSKAWTDAASRGYELLIEDGKLSWALIHFYPGNAIRVKTVEEAPVNVWYNVTITYDGSSRADGLEIYINGQKQKVEVIRDKLDKEIYYNKNKKADVPFLIGARMRDRGFKKGQVDELYYYQTELCEAEVLALHNGNQDILKTDRQHYASRYDKTYLDLEKQLLEKRQALNELLNQEREIMVMREMEQPRETYVLTRGLYNKPDLSKRVYASAPKAILPFTKEYPSNRLGLAQWLTDRRNPLTSRVAINRIWAQVFGKGIVQTPDDFGNQGELPTHPKLLDWLSVEFMNSGWDIKHMLKLMVMSKTFRQSSSIDQNKYMADANNDYYSYGPRRRLTAEMIRDQALYVSGKLNTKVGGQSENADSSRRRALYLHWKRNSPPPSMLIFDAPRRQVCSVKREATSTPLQALVLLNRDLYMNASKDMTYQLYQKHKGEPKTMLDSLYRDLMGRLPDDQEADICMQAYREQEQLFKQDESRYVAFADQYKFESLTEGKSWAAWSVVANLLLNHDDSITIR